MGNILNRINGPEDLRGLSAIELEALAIEIREQICETVSLNGGHLAPSLGVVELTLALHNVLDSPKDKIIWDVGHQAYTHKLLTGRREDFHTLRLEGGISGFPKRSESPHDPFGTGHAGTAISAALGMALARDIKGNDERIVAVVGDGAMTNGLSFEGLNNAGAAHRDMIVILNDNKMSISHNVGALSKYLTSVISTDTYNKLKKDIWDLTGYIPVVRQPVRVILNRVERSLKNLIVPGTWFEAMGFRYFGPVDGHDIQGLIQILKQIKKLEGPLLLHVYTTKGKGYCYAEEDSTTFHGISAFELSNGKLKKNPTRLSYSQVFGESLVEAARTDDRICAITAAMSDSTGLGHFAREFPERFFDVGIAEGHAVTFAGGLAASGMKPFVAIYSSFVQRCYDNIIHDLAIQKLPVVLCLDRAGFVGDDGPTHQGVFDISFLRHIPGLALMAPKDDNELKAMIKFATSYSEGPLAIRYPRGTAKISFENVSEDIKLGKAEILKQGSSAAILAIGETVAEALEAADILGGEGIDVEVVNMRFIHPMDTETLDRIFSEKKPVITVEENMVAGGFGAGVLEYASSKGYSSRIVTLGVSDEFVEQSTRKRQMAKYGLDAASIAETIRKAISG